MYTMTEYLLKHKLKNPGMIFAGCGGASKWGPWFQIKQYKSTKYKNIEVQKYKSTKVQKYKSTKYKTGCCGAIKMGPHDSRWGGKTLRSLSVNGPISRKYLISLLSLKYIQTKIQKYKNTKIQKYKYTKIQKYKCTKIQKTGGFCESLGNIWNCT